MSDFDIGLGVNWLAVHRAPIVCHTNRVIFEVKKGCLGLWHQQITWPDGFSFEFYCKYWTTIDEDVDFEKAFDSVKWDYLDETLKAFGFGSKWRNWISSCLNNAMGLVLVNGSPTLEFQFHKGLKQGIGVSSNIVAAAASLIGCSILTTPFNYLGVKNFYYEVDGSDRKLAWIGWNVVLTSKKNGGLGTHFIKAIFGNKGALDTHKLIPRRSSWEDVIPAIHSLQREVALKVLYKRLYALEMCKSISVAEKMGHPYLSHSFRMMPRGGVKQENYGLLCSKVADLVLPNISDRWCWSLEDSQEFSVKSSRILINNTILPKAEVPTRWLKFVPIKTLMDMLRSCALEWTGNWDEYLCLVEFAYNKSCRASIKAAPYEILERKDASYVLRSIFLVECLDHFVEIPYGEINVHIEDLSVLWGNKLAIPDGSLPLSRAINGQDDVTWRAIKVEGFGLEMGKCPRA
nr:RNA-directed DNA polymerase, eukaryota [Tanacetum cinerariifolium]